MSFLAPSKKHFFEPALSEKETECTPSNKILNIIVETTVEQIKHDDFMLIIFNVQFKDDLYNESKVEYLLLIRHVITAAPIKRSRTLSMLHTRDSKYPVHNIFTFGTQIYEPLALFIVNETKATSGFQKRCLHSGFLCYGSCMLLDFLCTKPLRACIVFVQWCL